MDAGDFQHHRQFTRYEFRARKAVEATLEADYAARIGNASGEVTIPAGVILDCIDSDDLPDAYIAAVWLQLRGPEGVIYNVEFFDVYQALEFLEPIT